VRRGRRSKATVYASLYYSIGSRLTPLQHMLLVRVSVLYRLAFSKLTLTTKPLSWIRSKMLKGLGRIQNLWILCGTPRTTTQADARVSTFESNVTPSSCEKLEPSRHQSDLLMVIFGVPYDFRIHSVMSLLEQMPLRLFEKI